MAIPLIPTLVMVIEIVNIVLLLGLLYIYVNSYRKVKSEFTMGLIFFISAFLVKSLMLLGTIRIIFHFIDEASDKKSIPFFLIMVNLIECAGLVILLRISWK